MELSFVGNVSENWTLWFQQFNIFLIASGRDTESDERKINILLNLIGSSGLKIYNNFKMKKNETYESIVEKFKNYCEPRKNEIFQRFKFASCVQVEGQEFDEFVTELKRLASSCSFKEEDKMIRDRIVFGIRNNELKDKLLRMESLTMEKAEELCRTFEATRKELKVMVSAAEEVDVQMVHKRRQANQSRQRQKENFDSVSGNIGKYKTVNRPVKNLNRFKNNNKQNIEYLCKKCNKNHMPKNCPAYGKICRNCNKYNHFEVGCKFKNKTVMETSKIKNTTSSYDSEDSDSVFQINEIKIDSIKNGWT